MEELIAIRDQNVSNRKASFVVFSLIFFIVSGFLFLLSPKYGLLSLLSIILGMILFVNGITDPDYGERIITEKDVVEDVVLRQAWHQEMELSIIISGLIGSFFFISGIVFFFLDPRKYFLILLFCDIVGVTIIVYTFMMSDYNKKIKKIEFHKEEVKQKILNKTWAYQNIINSDDLDEL